MLTVYAIHIKQSKGSIFVLFQSIKTIFIVPCRVIIQSHFDSLCQQVFAEFVTVIFRTTLGFDLDMWLHICK